MESHKSPVLRNVLLLILISPLGLVIWYFGASGPARPLPGSEWAQYESQVRSTVQSVGGLIEEQGCSMIGNVNAALVCPVAGVTPNALLAAFSDAGWKPESASSSTRGGARLSVESIPNSSSVQVAVSLRRQ
jgi:hypothetical protein